MKPSPLKLGLIAMPIIGVLGFAYIILSALVTSERGLLDTYARGEMSAFRSATEPPPQPGQRLVLDDGTETRLRDMRGKVLLVNFWATWCAPCVVEMPHLDALQAELGDEDFEVVTISQDQRIEDAASFFDERGLEHLTLYHDPSLSAAMSAGSRGLPTTVLYDRQGREIGRMDGEADWAGEDAMALIEAAKARY